MSRETCDGCGADLWSEARACPRCQCTEPPGDPTADDPGNVGWAIEPGETGYPPGAYWCETRVCWATCDGCYQCGAPTVGMCPVVGSAVCGRCAALCDSWRHPERYRPPCGTPLAEPSERMRWRDGRGIVEWYGEEGDCVPRARYRLSLGDWHPYPREACAPSLSPLCEPPASACWLDWAWERPGVRWATYGHGMICGHTAPMPPLTPGARPCARLEWPRSAPGPSWGPREVVEDCSPAQAEQGCNGERMRPGVSSGESDSRAQAQEGGKMSDSKSLSEISSKVRRRGPFTPCAAGAENAVRRALASDRVPGVCLQVDGPASELRSAVGGFEPGRLAVWGELVPAVAALAETLAALVACFEVGWRVLALPPSRRWRVRLGFPVGLRVADGRLVPGEGVSIDARDTLTGGWAPVLVLTLDTNGRVSRSSAWEIRSAWLAQGAGLRELGEDMAAALDLAVSEAGHCWGCPIAEGSDPAPCGGCLDQARALGVASFGVAYAPRCRLLDGGRS